MISNPSARYDAQGNAGIINIKLKKNRKYGLNGSVSAGLNVGLTPKTNSAISLNYRNKKSNWFSNYSNNWNENESDFYLFRTQFDSSYDQTSKQHSQGWSNNLKVGADFFLTKTQTLGFIATGNTSDMENYTQSRTPIRNIADGKTGQILYASNTLPSKNRNGNFNVNYRLADTAGHELNIDADYGMYRNRRSSYQPNAYYSSYPEKFLYERNYKNRTPADINILSAKIDYETPFKKGKFGVGIKFSDVKTDNTFDFYNTIGNADYIDSGRSNSFSYKENVNAAYVNYNRPVNQKWAIQTGLRVENTISDGKLTRVDGLPQTDDRVKRNYIDFFPSAAITFTQSMNHIFNLTYSRRIDRPNYQDLNPFENKLDELTYQKGNAFLRPQYTNSIEMTHTYKYRFNTTVSYSHIKDFRAQLIDSAEKTRSYITQRNLASQDIYNINFSLPFQITKWWSLYTNINAFHSFYKADFGEGKKVDLKVNSASIYMQQSFTIGGGYTGELSGFYSAPSVWAGTFRSKGIGNLDMGIQKQLFNGKGNFKVSYTDLLRTFKWAGTSDFGVSYIKVRGNWESQQLRMNLTYRFGSNEVKAARQRKTAAEEESKRTQGGGGGFGGN
ncbi:MAG: TonB-dependent receptor family protein [Chitinophagaceae bacterium]|nr:TonB-dependent receptor family protein [Chitinophagaceae bacterium]